MYIYIYIYIYTCIYTCIYIFKTRNKATLLPEISRQQVQKLTPQTIFCTPLPPSPLPLENFDF